MKKRCCWLHFCAMLLFLATSAQAADPGKNSRDKLFGPQDAWMLPFEALSACEDKNPTSTTCLTQVMQETGASKQALALNKMLGGDGYLSEFQPMGRIDLATCFFPSRANSNAVLFLVGGSPSLVSSELDAVIDIKGDPAYPGLKKKFPDLELWTSGASFGKMDLLPNGGQRFVFEYPLVNGCHACALAGYALIAHDFDPDGTYKGPRLIRLKPEK
ncbi:hypothetical protein [Solidesulfovibrio sp.]